MSVFPSPEWYRLTIPGASAPGRFRRNEILRLSANCRRNGELLQIKQNFSKKKIATVYFRAIFMKERPTLLWLIDTLHTFSKWDRNRPSRKFYLLQPQMNCIRMNCIHASYPDAFACSCSRLLVGPRSRRTERPVFSFRSPPWHFSVFSP